MAEESFHSDDVLVVERSPWIFAVPALVVGALIAGLYFISLDAAHPIPPSGFLFASLGLCALGIFWSYAAWRQNYWSESVCARTHASAERTTIGSHTIPRTAIKQAFLLPRGGRRPVVRITLKNWLAPDVDLELVTEGEARRLLRALGLDGSQTAASFRVPSRVLAHRYRSMAALLGMMAAVIVASSAHASAGFMMLAAPIGMFVLAFLFVAPSTLSVGVDGILLSWLGRKRFVRHAEIDILSTYEDGFGKSRYLGIELLLQSGEVIKIPIHQRGWDDGQVEIIEERIREAKGTSHHGAGDTAFLLGREGRSLTEWMTSLRAIGSGANATHRIAPIDHETLWQILEDPAAAASARAAAAVALRTELDNEGRARMQAAAQATVAPKVRVVLETAAGTAEEEELALALAELEDSQLKS